VLLRQPPVSAQGQSVPLASQGAEKALSSPPVITGLDPVIHAVTFQPI